jgi:tetratricopeptide (TPR) repeat protein
MRSKRLIALFLGASLAGGCATGSRGSLTREFDKPGKPAFDLGGPASAGELSLQEQMRMIRHLQTRPVMRASAGASAESSDRRLAGALAVEAASPTAENRLWIADEYVRLGILDTAYAYANRAILQEPRLAEAHELMARIWRDWGLPRLGIGPATRAVYFNPSSASAHNTLGTVFDALGQPLDARRAFARAVALDSKAGWALNNLCFVELRMGRLTEARSHCRAALVADPEMTAARNNLGLTFVASGDIAAAGQAFLATGSVADAAYNRGIVHMAQRSYKRAAEAFEEAIAARPGFTSAKTRAHEARMLVLTTSAHD